MVQSAETLRKIQGEHGVTGAFKDMTIAEWLAKHNPTELEYERAAQNFTGESMSHRSHLQESLIESRRAGVRASRPELYR